MTTSTCVISTRIVCEPRRRVSGGSGYHQWPRAGRDSAWATIAASPETNVISSELLLHRVSDGDAGAMRECITRYSGLVWSLARRMGLPQAECEDAVQEIFAAIWKSSGKYDPAIASETAFVAMIARRRLIDRRRKLGRAESTQTITDATPMPAAAAADPSLPEEARRAAALLTQLSPEQQRVLTLNVYHGLSHESIAKSTGLPLGTVKTHARRGLIRLRDLMSVGGATAAKAIGGDA